MKPENIILHHYWRSSCSWRVRWALELKKIPFELRPVNLLEDEHKSPSYLKINPSGQVPCLQMGNEFHSESLALIEWLDEIFPTPKLVFGTPLKRMKIRELAYKVSSGIQPIQNLSVMRTHSRELEQQREWSRTWIRKGFVACEKLLEKSATKFCFGSEVSLADLCLIPQVYNAKRFELNLTSFPKIERIYENALETEACQAAHPESVK